MRSLIWTNTQRPRPRRSLEQEINVGPCRIDPKRRETTVKSFEIIVGQVSGDNALAVRGQTEPYTNTRFEASTHIFETMF